MDCGKHEEAAWEGECPRCEWEREHRSHLAAMERLAEAERLLGDAYPELDFGHSEKRVGVCKPNCSGCRNSALHDEIEDFLAQGGEKENGNG